MAELSARRQCPARRQTIVDSSATVSVRLDGRGFAMSPIQRRTTRLDVVWGQTGIAGAILRPSLGDEQAVARQLTECSLEVWRAALGETTGRLAGTVTIMNATRSSRDNQGRSFHIAIQWCDLVMEMLTPWGLERVVDGTGDLDSVPRLLESMAAELRRRSSTPPQPLPSEWDGRGTVLLGPTVAAALIHEVAGHGAEELRPGYGPVHIGSDDLTVAAYHPRREGLDDEGVPVGRWPIVESGWLHHPLLDRSQALLHGGTPAGLAQAALHSGPPRARATHLRTHPGPRSVASLHAGVSDAVFCEDTSGAEFFGNRVLLAVSAAVRLCSGNHHERLQPFVITLDLNECSLRLAGVGDDVRPGRSARCVKGGCSLPTQTEAPTLLIDGVSFYAK